MKTDLVGVQLFDFSEDFTGEQAKVKSEPIMVNQGNLAHSSVEKLPKQKVSPDNTDKRFYCEPCGTYMNSKIVYDQHLLGKQHLKKSGQFSSVLPLASNSNETNRNSIEQPKNFTCDLCSVSTGSKDQLDLHFKGKKHMTKLALTTADTSKSNNFYSFI